MAMDKGGKQVVALLQTANASLQAYAQEVKRTTKIIKRQRTLAYVLAADVIAVAIAK